MSGVERAPIAVETLTTGKRQNSSLSGADDYTRRGRTLLARQALRIVFIYVCTAGAWIAISDRVLGALVHDRQVLLELSVYKGLFFIVATAGLLYVLLRRTFNRLDSAFTALEQKEAERREHERERARADAIVESSFDAIISCSLDGTISSWNPAAANMFGYSRAEALGRSLALLIPEDLVPQEQGLLLRLAGGEQILPFETLRRRKDGTPFPASVTFSPIWGSQENAAGGRRVVGASNIVRDIAQQKQAETLALREQGFANSLIEAMPGIFYLYTEQGRFLRWNRNFEKVSGYEGQAIAGLHPLQFFSADDAKLLQTRIAEVFERGESSVEANLVSRDGTATPYFFTGRRIVFDGKTCLVGVGVDITERKHAEAALSRSEERYRSTLDNILEGCQLLDFDWRYLYLNAAAAAQNRRPDSELLGHRLPDMWPGIEATPVFDLLTRCMQQRQAQHEEIEFAFPDGTKGWFDLRAQAVPEGVFILSIDISERKQAERALRDLNESLELKVVERTLDLDRAKVRAEAADKLKSAFLATMSHELRTPLNSIIGFTGIVLQGLAGPLTPEQSKQLGMVKSSARHLLDLINDVLDISKIEAGQLEIRSAPFDLRAVLDKVIALVAPLAQKKGLALRLVTEETLPPMDSDQRRVEQILINLLNNAIKFTDQGSVTLSVEFLDVVGPSEGKSARSYARLTVADTGIGMQQHDLSLLFQPFRQLDSGLHRQHEGTGLGLAICRRLTSLLGGHIQVESAFGQGSLFAVMIPMKASAS